MLQVFETPASRSRASSSGGEIEVQLPDRVDGDVPRARRRARPRGGRRVAPPVLRAAHRRRDRGLAETRLDRRRALPERLGADFRGAAYPVNRDGGAGGGRARLHVRGRDPRHGRPGRHLPVRAMRSTAAEEALRAGSAALRHLRGLRRGRAARASSARSSCWRPRPRARRAAHRPELPRHRQSRRRA